MGGEGVVGKASYGDGELWEGRSVGVVGRLWDSGVTVR